MHFCISATDLHVISKFENKNIQVYSDNIQIINLNYHPHILTYQLNKHTKTSKKQKRYTLIQKHCKGDKKIMMCEPERINSLHTFIHSSSFVNTVNRCSLPSITSKTWYIYYTKLQPGHKGKVKKKAKKKKRKKMINHGIC